MVDVDVIPLSQAIQWNIKNDQQGPLFLPFLVPLSIPCVPMSVFLSFQFLSSCPRHS
jgi:hypothetical protein